MKHESQTDASPRRTPVAVRTFVRCLAAAGLLVLGSSNSGCDYLGGRTIAVEFSSAAGIREDLPVYFAGVLVGKTGEPRLVRGKAQVPVVLMRQHSDALVPSTVFALSRVPGTENEPCLVAHDVGAVLPENMIARSDLYHGFTNEFELAMVVGAAKAKEFLESFAPSRER